MARPESIAVVVLGDLDRSPRMCNHAFSAAQSKIFADVTLIGYSSSGLNALPVSIRNNKRIHPRFLSTTLVD